MFFSVIIATYNSEKVIEQCLESVVKQSFRDYEIIIVDGASKDKTLQILSDYKGKVENRLHYVSAPDKGVYDAMNKGILAAKGEYIYFLGSDDSFYNEEVLFKVHTTAQQQKNPEIIYGNVFSPDLGEKFDGPFDQEKILQKNLCHQSIFYRRTLFQQQGVYNLKYPVLADYEFNLQCFLDQSIRKHYIEEIIAYYAPGGLSNKMTFEQFVEERNEFIREHGWYYLKPESLKVYYKNRIRYYFDLLKNINKIGAGK